MKKYLRFSLATLIVFVAVVALGVYWWPIPEGLQSSRVTTHNGIVKHQTYTWYDNANSMLLIDDLDDGSVTWESFRPQNGKGSVAYLNWGMFQESTTGGESTTIEIQFPSTVSRWQTISLRPPSAKRDVDPNDPSLSRLLDGEVSISRFVNPRGFSIAPDRKDFEGTASVLGVTTDHVTIKLDLPDLPEFDISAGSKIYLLKRTIMSRN